MARGKKEKLSLEELIEQAVVNKEEQPYEVPSNWVWTYLGQCTNLRRGASPRPINAYITEDKDGVNWIKIGDTTGEKYLYKTQQKITKEGAKKSVYLEKGTLILSNSMSFGKPFILECNGCIHDGWLSVTFYNNNIIKEYMYYSLLASQWYFEQVAVGSAVRNLNIARVASMPFPLPPLAEQQRIVDRIESLFEKLDIAKELAQNALDSFENRKAAILHKAFTGELTAKWREENGVSLESWEEKILGETDLQIIDGDRGKNYPTKDEFLNRGYCLFLNAKNVTKSGFKFEELNFITEEKDRLLKKGKLERFDLVLTTRGTIGNMAYFDEDIPYENMRINSGMVIYRGGKEFYKPFILWLYQSNYIIHQINTIQTGSAQPQLPIKVMKNLKLIIPSIREQEEIVNILNKLLDSEQQAQELCNVIEKIDLMKKAILARAFRGELGTNEPEEESAMELLKEVLKKKL